MSAPATANDLLSLVRQAGLLDEPRFAERFPAGAELPTDPRQAADALNRAGLLTRFQAERVLAGRARELALGPFVLLRPLGDGGQRFLAEHRQLKRKAAIELLVDDPTAGGPAAEQFLQRVRAAAALHHPSVIRVDDVYHDGELSYVVTEYVDGTDLAAMVRSSGPFEVSQAVQYVVRAAAGLQHIHDRGLVHGAVTPANLMVSAAGAVKVVGLVRPIRPGSQTADAADDIAGLGATLATLLADDRPADLADVIARMTAADPLARYRTMGQVIEALAPWTARVPSARTTARVDAATATATTSLRPAVSQPAPPGRRWWPIAVAVAAAAVVFAGGVYWATRSPAPAAKPPVAAPEPAVVAAPAPTFRPLSLQPVAHTQTYDSLFGNANDLRARLVFSDWKPKEYRGVPFHVIDPEAGAINNAVALYSSNRPGVTDRYPRSFKLPVNAPVSAVHVLGGVAGWGHPFPVRRRADQPGGTLAGTPAVLVRLRYTDGTTDEHVWRNGEHITDYNKAVDAVGSEVAFEVEPSRFLRYLVVRPARVAEVRELEFAKSPLDEFTAPIFLAVTVESPAR